MATEIASSAVAILGRIIRPESGSLSAAAARAWLKLRFSDSDRARMRALVQKARECALNPREKRDLDNYRRVGRLLDMMHSKARISLQKRRVAG